MTPEKQFDSAALSATKFDVLIIGGGITGAWTALDCANRGLKTALIERGDFGGATSSASSKLLHGGIRYLQQLEFGRVRESAMERAQYIYAAPHLSHYVPFVVPTYKELKKSKAFMTAGMLAYKTLCLGENRIIRDQTQRPPGFRLISKREVTDLCGIDDDRLTGGIVFYERHLYDTERTVLSVIQTARQLGALCINYVGAAHYQFDASQQRVSGVLAVDHRSGKSFPIAAELTINAAGPWVDTVNHQTLPQTPIINGFAKGSHIVINRQLSDHAIALTTRHKSATKIDRGGRHIFAIPWRGLTLIGTSYQELDKADGDLSITDAEIQQLIGDVNSAMPGLDLSRGDILSGYSGIYPLHTHRIENSVYQGSGEYQLIDHAATDRIDGLVTALGAKFTTGRKIAELATNLACQKSHHSAGFQKIRLHDARYDDYSAFVTAKIRDYGQLGHHLVEHLIRCYGSNIDEFLSFASEQPELMAAISARQPDILAQAVWAVKKEMASSLSDIVFRRTSVGFLGISKAELTRLAQTVAPYCGWTAGQIAQQLADCMRILNLVKTTEAAAA